MAIIFASLRLFANVFINTNENDSHLYIYLRIVLQRIVVMWFLVLLSGFEAITLEFRYSSRYEIQTNPYK